MRECLECMLICIFLLRMRSNCIMSDNFDAQEYDGTVCVFIGFFLRESKELKVLVSCMLLRGSLNKLLFIVPGKNNTK